MYVYTCITSNDSNYYASRMCCHTGPWSCSSSPIDIAGSCRSWYEKDSFLPLNTIMVVHTSLSFVLIMYYNKYVCTYVCMVSTQPNTNIPFPCHMIGSDASVSSSSLKGMLTLVERYIRQVFLFIKKWPCLFTRLV